MNCKFFILLLCLLLNNCDQTINNNSKELSIQIPGSKSIINRLLILACLAQEDITIDNMSIIKAGKLVSDNDTVEQHKDILQMATVYVVFKV